MDKIFLHGLKADTLIGVYEWERKQPQTLLIDLDIGLPPRRADDDDIVFALWLGLRPLLGPVLVAGQAVLEKREGAEIRHVRHRLGKDWRRI